MEVVLLSSMTKPRSSSRGSYGGSAGVFFRRKCLRLSASSVTPSPEANATVAPSKLILPNNPKRPHLEWDDERCRPVFQSDPSASVLDSTSGTEASSEDEESVVGGEMDEGSPIEETEEEPITPHKTSPFRKKQRKTLKKTYGSMERPLITIVSPRLVGQPLLPTIMTTPAQPTPGKPTICTALDSQVKMQKFTTSKESVTHRGRKTTKQFHKQGNQSQPSPLTTENTNCDEPSIFDFKDEPNSTQPSSTASIDQVKAFFDNLDKSHALQLDASATPLRPKEAASSSLCVRTQRPLSLQDDQLKQDYQAYVQASTENGIEPVTVELFARNRSSFFRTHQLYDGFLDE